MLEVKVDPAESKTALGANTVRLTFLPSGQSVEFEAGKLPYQDHGKPQSILDVAMNLASTWSTPAAGIARAPPAMW